MAHTCGDAGQPAYVQSGPCTGTLTVHTAEHTSAGPLCAQSYFGFYCIWTGGFVRRKKNNVAYMKEHGFAEEMLDGLLNLDLALHCDGFVSSINSNWAR